jgi:HEAT repeat protein
MLGHLAVAPALADGCFVFKWDKYRDINEPTQKAIILHDGGREDLLLQVKYEGPMEDFGWLIPVPALPKIEKGSMDPFYELSELTQRQFATRGVVTMGLATAGESRNSVKVIEVKTVGAYEVAVLSATDTGSLEHWLKLHGYSIPDQKSEVINEYLRKNWYFIAAKIQLNKATSVDMVSGGGPQHVQAATPDPKALQKKLASGELHPLLISFDSPQCMFPLKISSIGGKPSEISIYVLSKEPLLNKFLFEESLKGLEKQYAEWDRDKARSADARQNSIENLRVMSMAFQMSAADRPNAPVRESRNRRPDWTVEDLKSMAREGQPPAPHTLLDFPFYASPGQILECLHVQGTEIPKTIKVLPRLKSGSWFVTKMTRTFAPSEMQDLRFEPAIPVLAEVLPRPTGRSAAELLAQLGTNGVSVLMTACKSKDSTERLNAAFGLERLPENTEQTVGAVLNLLADESAQVRLYAIRAAESNWDPRLTNALVSLFRDPNQQIRSEAAGCLSMHELKYRTAEYVALLKDRDPNVRVCSLRVLTRLDRAAIQPSQISAMLKDPDLDAQSAALHAIWLSNHDMVPREDLLPLLGSGRIDVVSMALRLIEGTGLAGAPLPAAVQTGEEALQYQRQLSSSEAVLLITNQLAAARLMGLKILKRNGDSQAVDLTLPLLKDKNRVVRSRALNVLTTLTGQNISESDPDKWEQWWQANRTTFGTHPVEQSQKLGDAQPGP